MGTKDRETNKIAARVVENNDGPTLKGFIGEHTAPGAKGLHGRGQRLSGNVLRP